MPIVTDLKLQKSKKRVNVYIDQKFGFGIDFDNLAILDIRIDKEFTQDELNEIIKKAEFSKTLDRVLFWAQSRPHSKKEFLDYFKRKKVPEILFDQLFNKLAYYGFINDEDFAHWWAKQRINFKNKSLREIEYELRQKGIEKEIISKIKNNYENSEEVSAKKLITKREHYFDKFEEKKAKQKKIEYLARKGFSFEIIKKVL